MARQKNRSRRNSLEDQKADTEDQGKDTRLTWTTNPLRSLHTTTPRPARNTGPERATHPPNSPPASDFPTKRVIAEQTDRPPLPAPETVEKWQKNFAAQRKANAIDHPRTTDDVSTLKSKMQAWPDFDRTSHCVEAKQLGEALLVHKGVGDAELRRDLSNMLAQSGRQQVIQAILDKPGDLQVLGLLAGDSGRLEAITAWKTIEGSTSKSDAQNADYWHSSFKKVLYVQELTSAPWNVGWPTEQVGVRGAGRAMITELTNKAKENDCDGIGLFGLHSNVDFYLRMGFEFKAGFNRESPGGFPPLFLKVPK